MKVCYKQPPVVFGLLFIVTLVCACTDNNLFADSIDCTSADVAKNLARIRSEFSAPYSNAVQYDRGASCLPAEVRTFYINLYSGKAREASDLLSSGQLESNVKDQLTLEYLYHTGQITPLCTDSSLQADDADLYYAGACLLIGYPAKQLLSIQQLAETFPNHRELRIARSLDQNDFPRAKAVAAEFAASGEVARHIYYMNQIIAAENGALAADDYLTNHLDAPLDANLAEQFLLSRHAAVRAKGLQFYKSNISDSDTQFVARLQFALAAIDSGDKEVTALIFEDLEADFRRLAGQENSYFDYQILAASLSMSASDEHLHTAEKMWANNAYMLTQKAIVSIRAERWDQALDALDAAIKQAPSEIQLLATKASILASLGRCNEFEVVRSAIVSSGRFLSPDEIGLLNVTSCKQVDSLE